MNDPYVGPRGRAEAKMEVLPSENYDIQKDSH